PWVHVNDVGQLVLFAIDRDELGGPVNCTAPGIVTHGEFAKTLGRVMSRPALLPVPRFALRLRFGEVANAITASLRVAPEVATKHGFRFQFRELEPALENLLHRSHGGA